MKNIVIKIGERVWLYLNQKKKPGEAFNDVLERELKITKEAGQFETPTGSPYTYENGSGA